MTSIDEIFNDNETLVEEPLPVFEKNWQMQINICDSLYLGSKISKYYMEQQVIPNRKWLMRYLNAHPLIIEHTDVVCYAAEFSEPYPEYCRNFQEARKNGKIHDCGPTFYVNAKFRTKTDIYRFILDIYYLTVGGEYNPWVMTFRKGELFTMVFGNDVKKINQLMFNMKGFHEDTSLSNEHFFKQLNSEIVKEEDIDNIYKFILNACKK